MGPELPLVLVTLGLLGVATVCWVVRHQRRRQQVTKDQAGEVPEWVELVDRLCSELEEVCNQLDARLAARCARLEQLLQAADTRGAQLENLLSRAPVPADASAPLAEAEAKIPAGHQRQPTGVGAGSPEQIAAEPAPMGDGLSQLGQQVRDVCALADAGLTPVRIAEETGLSLGEVQLALNLRDYVSVTEVRRVEPPGAYGAFAASAGSAAS